MIPFNRPPCAGSEEQYIKQTLNSNKLSGDGPFEKKCQCWFKANLPARKGLPNKSTQPWVIYAGNPARRIKDQKQDLLELEMDFLKGEYE